jgi:GINS complex subunit 2
MATPTPPGLTPSESAFLAESEQVTVVPRSALPAISLLAGPTPELRPPHRASVPLWLALLLKKQGRANVVPPLWLNAGALESVLAYENANEAFAPAPRFAVSEERRGALRCVETKRA